MSLADSRSESRVVFVQKQAANIYTMLLILAFLAITLGCLFLYLEMRTYNMNVKVPPEARVPPPSVSMLEPPTAPTYPPLTTNSPLPA